MRKASNAFWNAVTMLSLVYCFAVLVRLPYDFYQDWRDYRRLKPYRSNKS